MLELTENSAVAKMFQGGGSPFAPGPGYMPCGWSQPGWLINHSLPRWVGPPVFTSQLEAWHLQVYVPQISGTFSYHCINQVLQLTVQDIFGIVRKRSEVFFPTRKNVKNTFFCIKNSM